MKKMIFAAAIVVLAVLVAGCEIFEEPELEKAVVVYDENGEPWGVELGINVPNQMTNAKALTKPLALAGVDYYEAVFAHAPDGTTDISTETLIRRSWRAGGQVRVTVPFGNYNNTSAATEFFSAYLFAGRYDTKTLLAVGRITLVNGTAGTTISNTTTSVTFALTALETDWGGLGGTPTFSATQGGPALGIITNRVRINDNPVPIILFARTAPVSAIYNIGGIDMSTTHAGSIVVNGDPTISSKGFIYGEGDFPLGTLAPASAFTNNNTGTATVPIAFQQGLTMNLVPPNKDGLGIFWFEIPVMAYSVEHNPLNEPAPIQWYIRGGINNEIIDAGAAHNFGDGSIGGAVLYGVGNVLDGAGFLVITQPVP